MTHVAAEHRGQRTICIAIDDFGLHEGIDQAAFRLVEIGRAQAIGCMVGGPSWARHGPAARRLAAADIDLGLHLDFTEKPLLPGTMRPLNALIRDSFLGRLARNAVRAEIRAQLDAFEQAIGRAPAYIDGHQHVHQFPTVRDELLAELAERYRGVRPWLRSTCRARGMDARARQRWPSSLKPWVIQRLGAAGLAAAAGKLGFPMNARLLGVYDFAGGPDHYARLMTGWLISAGQADLLMCHPSVATDAADPMIAARQAEFGVLASATFGAQLTAASLVLRPMSRILRASSAAAGASCGVMSGQGGD